MEEQKNGKTRQSHDVSLCYILSILGSEGAKTETKKSKERKSATREKKRKNRATLMSDHIKTTVSLTDREGEKE